MGKLRMSEEKSPSRVNHAKNGLKQHQWKKGVSGNPSGRPKGAKTSLAVKLKKIGESEAPKEVLKVLRKSGWDTGDNSINHAILMVIVNNALQGDHKFVDMYIRMMDAADSSSPRDKINNMFMQIVGVDPGKVGNIVEVKPNDS